MLRRILPLGALVLALTPSCEEPSVEKTSTPTSRWVSQFPVLREPSTNPQRLRVATNQKEATTEIEDITSHVKVRVRLATPMPRNAIFQRIHARGVEDFLAFDARPPKEEARYTIDVSEVAGLRVIDKRSVEVLDPQGAPRLRVDPPYAIDANGTRIDASLEIEECAYDTNPAAPWDRPVTPPGSTSCSLVVRWSSTSYPLLVDPNWVETATGTIRDEHTSVKLANGKVLVTYGSFAGQGLSPGAELYDPITKTIANTGSPGDRTTRRPAILLPNDKALVLGATANRVYDPTTGTFSETANTAASAHDGGTLTRLPSGKILVAGGGTLVEIYDATTNRFSAGPSMNVARSFHAAALLKNGKVLVAGGGTNTAELYDPAASATGSFTRTTGNMTFARTDHEAVTLPSGKVFIVGGDRTAELFDPATGRFTATTGSMVDSRTRVRATLMPSGNVFVTGGFVGNTASALVERYEPALGVFTTAPVLNRARGFHIAELLDTGAIMVHGGRTSPTNFGEPLGDVEELSVNAAGASCLHADDCASGICDLGTCCLTTCTDVCKSCAPGTGACDVVRNADDLSSCTGNNTCDANGACKKKNGQTCTAAGECASGFCTDGVCCNVACNGQCEACDGIQKGRCEPVVGAPKGGRPACATDQSNCGGACNGIKTASCNYPALETACGTSKCSNAVRIPSACNAEGACKELAPRPCPGNFACLDDQKCRDRCEVTERDCAVGYVCENGACTLAGKCDGDHRVISTDLKSVTDCTPYVCDDTNRCRTTCEDVGHCTAPFACNRYGQCVDPASTIATGSGCAFSRTTTSSIWTKSAPILLALLVLSRTIRRSAKDGNGRRRRIGKGRRREPEPEPEPEVEA